MTDTTTSSPGEDLPTMILIAAILVTAILSLTSVAAVAALLAVTLYWLTGRKALAIGCLLIALGLFVIAVYMGMYADIRDDLHKAYFDYLTRGGSFSEFLKTWVYFIFNPHAWLPLGSIGLAIGAGIALDAHSRASSSLNALTEGRILLPPSRAPIAPLLHRIINYRSPRAGKSVVLGSEWRTGIRINISEADLNRHLLIAGTTGTGKTNSIKNVVEAVAPSGLVIVDGKGDLELAKDVMAFAQERGQKAYLIEPTGALASAIYNPLASGDSTSLTDRVMTVRQWTEPHYKILALGFAQTAFKVLRACGQHVDLLSVSDALDVDYLLALIRTASKSTKNKSAFQALAKEVSDLRESEGDISGLRAELRNIAKSSIGPMFDTRRAIHENIPVLNLKTAREEKAIVYFCLPALIYPERASYIGKMIINDLKFVTSTSRATWPLMMDEFSVFAGEQVLNLLNQGRSYGLSVILATQSLDDIAKGSDKDGGRFLNQVLGSINSYLIHRLNTGDDREMTSKNSGTITDIEYTAQTLGGKGSGAASARHIQRFSVHPDAIRSLEDGNAFIVNNNKHSVELIRVRKSTI